MRRRFLGFGLLFLVAFDGGSASAQTFDAKGIKLHYIVEGKGQPVILIHGLRSSISMNWRTPGIVNLLSKNYQVIALDLPGHGESDKPMSDAAYGTEMVEDVVRLMDHLNLKRAHIVGYSMGGMIAMKFMARHQDRVLSGIVGGMGWLREGGALQKVWERMPERQAGGPLSICARSLGKLALTEAELKAITVPVEVIVGDRDPTKRLYVIPLEPVRKDWHVVEIKDAGHLNCIAKQEFKDAIVEWLTRHQSEVLRGALASQAARAFTYSKATPGETPNSVERTESGTHHTASFFERDARFAVALNGMTRPKLDPACASCSRSALACAR